MGATVDWEALRAAYVTSMKSYRQIGRDYGVSYGKVAAHGKAEDWPGQRLTFRAEAASRAIAAEVRNEADRLGKILEAANAMSDVIHDVFDDKEQFHRHLVQESCDRDMYTVERVYGKVDTRAIKDLTGALKDMTLVLRNLNNLPTQAEAEAQRIAAERLKLDQRKADAAEGADKEIRVVLAQSLEGLAE